MTQIVRSNNFREYFGLKFGYPIAMSSNILLEQMVVHVCHLFGTVLELDNTGL